MGGKGGLRERDMTPKQERLYQIFLWKRKQGKLTPKEKEFFESLQTIKDEENEWISKRVENIEKLFYSVISTSDYVLTDESGYKVYIHDWLNCIKENVIYVLENGELKEE